MQDDLKDQLYCAPELATFYDFDNGWGAGLEYCRDLAAAAHSVLDLGCGTGLFLSRLPDSCKSVGVDPAGAMLEIARNRPGGARVKWIEEDALKLRLADRFDLIVMTGHAFQVFLTEENQRAALRTIAYHIAPGGRFIFDTRNPVEEDWRNWTPDATRRSFKHPELGQVESWNDVSYDRDTAIVTYQTHYRIIASDTHFSAESQIKFTSQKQLASMLADTGLAVETWLGDWNGDPFTMASPEIIPIGHLSQNI